MKQLIEDGADEMARLRDEAHKVGIVMDADLVKRGGELNDKFETVSKVIDVQLKSALVDLGPIISGLVGLLAQLAKNAADTADSFKSIENKRTSTLQRRRDSIAEALNNPNPYNRDAQRRDRAIRPKLQAQLDELDNLLGARAAATAAPQVKPTRNLLDTSGAGAGRSSRAEDPFKAINAFAKLDEQIKQIQSDKLKAFFEEYTQRGEQGQNAEIKWKEALDAIYDEILRKAFEDFKGRGDQGQNAQVFWEEQAAIAERTLHDGVYDGIRGALEALADGDIVEYFANSLKKALLDSAAEALTQAFLQAAAPNGLANGGFLAKAAGFLGVPGFANGTSFAPGGMAWVGERGRELVNLPRGSQVIPNHALPGIPTGGGGGGRYDAVPVDITINMAGANGNREVEAIARRASAQGVAEGLRLSRKGAPAVQRNLTLLGTP
jgi:hypothetical protein